MTTLEIMKMKAEEAMAKARRAQPLNAQDLECLKIFNSIHAKKAGNSGKRKVIKTGK